MLFAVLFFGSNFIVVKEFDSGDGFFFQLFLCLGIWTMGLLVQMIRGSPDFHPYAMFGGALWACGNVFCPFIIKRIGMGMGLVVWGCTALLVGWITGFAGLFGLPKDEIKTVWLNILGVCFAVASLVTSFFVQTSKGKVNYEQLPGQEYSVQGVVDAKDIDDEEFGGGLGVNSDDEEDQPKKGTTMGFILAIFAGLFFGNNFDPPTYIQTHNCQGDNACDPKYRGASDNPLDYVFAHFTGILLMSMVLFFGYTIYKKNNPWINAKLCLPAFLSGMMWAVAQVGWFVANGSLGYTTAFPLVTIGPGFVGSMWSVFWFKTITGKRNFLVLGLVFMWSVTCSICIVISHG